MASTTHLLTFEEFERLPDTPGKRELLDGELIELPPPKRKHSRIQLRIHSRLRPYVLDRRLGELHMGAGFKLGSRGWVQPDLSLITDEQDRSGDPEGYFEEAPRLAVEIISPSNTAQSVDRKLARYFEYGSEEVWVFYPASRRVWLYRRNQRVAIEQRDVLESKMFPGWKLDLAEIFA